MSLQLYTNESFSKIYMEIFTSQEVSTVEEVKEIDKIGKMIWKKLKQPTKLANLIPIDAPKTDNKSYDGNTNTNM